MRIQHVNVLVDDLEAATRFYRDVLGLPPMPPPDQGFPSQFFRCDGDQQLHVNQLPDDKPFRSHFCLVVDDFPALFRRLEAAGAIDVRPWGRARRLPNGALQMFVRDPAGNLIELGSQPGAAIDEDILRSELFDPEVGMYRLEPPR